MAVEVAIQPPTDEDAVRLAERMRAADAAEVRASSGEEPLPVVRKAIAQSAEVWAVAFNGELACIFGVVKVRDSAMTGLVGCAWLLGTDVIERHPVTFWKLCRQLLPVLFERWDALINCIDSRHAQALRWARRLGFKLKPPGPFGAEGRDFCDFTVTRRDLHV